MADIVESFRKLIIDMHRGIPKYVYFGIVEKIIPNQEIRDYFFKRDVFVKSKTKHQNGQEQYFLGINGIILANNYKMEILSNVTTKLTKSIEILTCVLVLLTLILIFLEVNGFSVLRDLFLWIIPTV